MQNIKAKEVITYVTMPRIVPRLRELFTSGFGYIPFLMAQVYSIVRLIPLNHPYLRPDNIGRFGIRHVVAEAARNLKFSRNNIDQIIIFVAMLAGLVLIFVQLALVIYALFVTQSSATSFDTAAPQFDIAFNLLDQIFGVPNIFCSITVPANCTDYATLFAMPLPFHAALHGLFQFYSTALLMIAVLIFLYFMVVVVLETAVSGTPFGQRFQNIWVPIRLVVAIGLLMPVSYGLNSGQYIVLYTAKYGSGLATNGWINFNSSVASHSLFGGNGVPLGERYSYLVLPEAPDFSPLLEAMSLVHACAYAYHRLNGAAVGAPLLPNKTRGGGAPYPDISANYAAAGLPDPWYFQIQPFLVKPNTAGLVMGNIGTSPIYGIPGSLLWIQDLATVPYWAAGTMSALGFFYGGDIVIRFGEYRIVGSGDPVYTSDVGNVKPLCGDIRIPITDLTDPGGSYAGRGGADEMQRFYYEMVLDLWFNAPVLRRLSRTLVENAVEKDAVKKEAFCNGTEASTGDPLSIEGDFEFEVLDCTTEDPSANGRAYYSNFYTSNFVEPAIISAWDNYVSNSIYANYGADIQSRGWGGAGIWYNKIAEINGGWMDAVRNIPYMDKYPLIMEEVRKFRQQNSQGTTNLELFQPSVKADGENSAQKKFKTSLGEGALDQIALPLYRVFQFWNPKNNGKFGYDMDKAPTENVFLNAINLLLGTTGLMNIRGANQYMHPMAQLVAVGKGLINSAVLGIAGTSVSSFVGGVARGIDKNSGIAGFAESASKVFSAVAFIGLTAGFVLFYVLPFLPFLYFYFAVASWVKAIFEAMLGVPLWALAHMRIDGDGLPGDSAANGYFLILEIFVRPILTVFGLLAAIIIFSAQVRILNIVWDTVTVNAAGFTKVDDIVGTPPATAFIQHQRGILDQFFFTIIYTIICYMLALASFKLIDKIPDNILRWAGAGVSSYGDIAQDQVDSISRYATTGAMTLGNQASTAISGATGGLGNVIGKAISGADDAAAAAAKKGG